MREEHNNASVGPTAEEESRCESAAADFAASPDDDKKKKKKATGLMLWRGRWWWFIPTTQSCRPAPYAWRETAERTSCVYEVPVVFC